jgi:hypothetical protein
VEVVRPAASLGRDDRSDVLVSYLLDQQAAEVGELHTHKICMDLAEETSGSTASPSSDSSHHHNLSIPQELEYERMVQYLRHTLSEAR